MAQHRLTPWHIPTCSMCLVPPSYPVISQSETGKYYNYGMLSHIQGSLDIPGISWWFWKSISRSETGIYFFQLSYSGQWLLYPVPSYPSTGWNKSSTLYGCLWWYSWSIHPKSSAEQNLRDPVPKQKGGDTVDFKSAADLKRSGYEGLSYTIGWYKGTRLSRNRVERHSVFMTTRCFCKHPPGPVTTIKSSGFRHKGAWILGVNQGRNIIWNPDTLDESRPKSS